MCECIWKERYELAMKKIENNMRICEEEAIRLSLYSVSEDDYQIIDAYLRKSEAYSNALSIMRGIRRVH